jgi:predicted transcriptional regulator YheO
VSIDEVQPHPPAPSVPSPAPSAASAPPEGFHVPRTVDGQRLVQIFRALVEPIARALPSSTEVVLHDLSLVPNSIVAIHGSVTGRAGGGPPTDVLLRQVSQGFDDYNLDYESTLPDGRRMRSSTMLIRDIDGHPAAALCIHTDLSSWLAVDQLVSQMIRGSGATAEPPVSPTTAGEVFPRDVDELAAHLIHEAIGDSGVPVAAMKKKHKLAVVEELQARGVFLLRDAVEMVAEALSVSKFTIYNYVNELSASGGAVAEDGTRG